MLVLISSNAWADTHSAGACAGTITSALQSAVNAASSGDTVSVGAGSCTSGNVSWTNKNITIQGAGDGVTNINTGSNSFLTITQSVNPASFRVTGMSLTGTTSQLIRVNPAFNSPDIVMKGFRIDHITFDYQAGSALFTIGGVVWGLIDHCTFNSTGSTGYEIMLPGPAVDSDFAGGQAMAGDYSASLPVNLGSDEAVYFEDNTVNFNNPLTVGITDGLYGSRVVIRHNVINGAYAYTHSARDGERGAKVIEYYNNSHDGKGFGRIMQLRSASGVIFNNYFWNYGGGTTTIDLDDQRACGQVVTAPSYGCTGTSSKDGNIEANGWPCLDQIGRGAGAPGSQASMPLYGWKNGSTPTCATGGACNNSVTFGLNYPACGPVDFRPYIKSTAHSNGDVDYVENGSTPKPGYVPYTYPHPLQGGGGGDTATKYVPWRH